MAETENSKEPLPSLIAKFNVIRRDVTSRENNEPVEDHVSTQGPISALAQLPIWPDSVRGVPNSVLRSALFGAIKRGKRAFMLRVQLAAVDGVTVLFTGPRLDQADLDVWEQCMHIARKNELGTRIRFAAYGFLKAIGKNTSGANHEWLKGAFARLASSVVEIKDGKKAYFGPMIHHGTRDDESGQYCIEINPAIASLYGKDGWSQSEWAQRQALRGLPIAQWLHGFYITHAEPYSLKVSTIHRLCGSEAKLMKHFREELRGALGKMGFITGWKCEINANDLVYIQKKPTASQSRYLIENKPNRVN